MTFSYKLEQENEDIEAVRQSAKLAGWMRGRIHKAHHSDDQI